MIISKRRHEKPDESDERTVQLTEADLISLEERIIQLLKTSGGEQITSRISSKTWVFPNQP